MSTRLATVWDAPVISDLWVKLMEEVKIPGRIADDIEKERFFISLLSKIKREDSCVVVVEDGGDIIGFASCFLQYYDHGTSDLVGTCDNIYLEKGYRGKGVMDDMLSILITFVKSYGAKQLEFLTVYDPSLVKVWTRKGYTPAQVIYIKEV